MRADAKRHDRAVRRLASKSARWLHVLAGGLRYLGANCSLNAGLGPRIVKADVTKRMPRLRILIVTEDISCEVVKESVVVFLQFVKEIWVYRLLDLC